MSTTAVRPGWAHTGRRYTMHRFPREVERELRVLNRSDNWHALLAWAQDVAWIALCVVSCVMLSWWFYPLAVLVIGARQRGLSTILHDCAHGVGAANKRLQMVIGTVLTAYPIFQQHYAYKLSHVQTHHPRLGDPDRDPDLRFFIEQGAYSAAGRRSYVLRVVLMPVLGSQTWSYLRYLVRNRYRLLRRDALHVTVIRRRVRNGDRIAFWLFWAVVATVAWQTGCLAAVALFWLVPYLTSFQILGWYIELSEHTPLVRDSSIDLYMTRNRTSRGLERFLTAIHGDNFHLEHHLDPRTPFWNLARARQARLVDPSYAEVDRAFGGLFTRGPQGQPSAISAIINDLTRSNEDASHAAA
jgi:fatty acid desaturase